jgi:hypothetical protein
MLGRIAAQHFAAGLTDTQMHPATVHLPTLLTAKHGIVGFWN